MKKRILALAAAMVLTLSMGMTALAANSPVVDDTPDQEGYATTASAVIGGATVALDFTWDEINMYAQATDAQRVELLKYFDAESEAAQDAYVKSLFESVTGYTADKAPMVKDYFSLDLPEGYTMPAGGIDITIEAPYAQTGDNCWFLLHLKEDGTWEYIKTTAGDKTLTGRFTSLSPVYVVYAPGAKAPATQATATPAPTTQATAKTTTTAPKTGETVGVQMAGMLALISAAGIVVYLKKQKKAY